MKVFLQKVACEKVSGDPIIEGSGPTIEDRPETLKSTRGQKSKQRQHRKEAFDITWSESIFHQQGSPRAEN
jgi:hypothetical protein